MVKFQEYLSELFRKWEEWGLPEFGWRVVGKFQTVRLLDEPQIALPTLSPWLLSSKPRRLQWRTRRM